MSTSTKKKAVRPMANPSYRAIQLAILAELRVHTALLTTLCKHQDDANRRADWTAGNSNFFAPKRLAVPIKTPGSTSGTSGDCLGIGHTALARIASISAEVGLEAISEASFSEAGQPVSPRKE